MKQLLLALMVLVFGWSTLIHPIAVHAEPLTKDQQKDLFQNPNWVEDTCDVSTAAAGNSGSGGAGEAFSDKDKVIFVNQPVTATWNISDSTVEDWFLKQAGARAKAIPSYGLNKGNIGAITSAVKAANVSPVFFYAYTVTEGGGAGGFINHYGDEAGGGGVGNAKRDAEYIASQSKIMTSAPSWIDAGNPVDFVPADVKKAGEADFKKMPAGTIGRAFIPATAAAAWDAYYPKGLKAEYNKVQNYGPVLSLIMGNIKNMGGDPLQGGATVVSTSTSECSSDTSAGGGVAGEGITKAINFALEIAKNDGYGYDQPTRTSGYTKWKSDPSCTSNCGSFDCSSFISAALTEAGYFKNNPNFATPGEGAELEKAGFKKIASSARTSENLKPGDILINTSSHTAMYLGDNKMVDASINEKGGIAGGAVGDQTKQEIKIHTFNDHPWDAVYRAQK